MNAAKLRQHLAWVREVQHLCQEQVPDARAKNLLNALSLYVEMHDIDLLGTDETVEAVLPEHGRNIMILAEVCSRYSPPDTMAMVTLVRHLGGEKLSPAEQGAEHDPSPN